MGTPPDEPFITGTHSFPRARQGYDRSSVDRYTAELHRLVELLRRESAALTADNHRLTEMLRDLETKYERIRTARLDERAQDILTAAEQQAAEVVAQSERAAAQIVREAQRDAEIVEERARQELAWRRRKLLADRAELDRRQEALGAEGSAGPPPASSSPEPVDHVADEHPATSDLETAQPGPA